MTDDFKVTMNEPAAPKPAPRALAEGNVVTDSAGRRIGIRRLSALDKARIFRAIGGDGADNNRYLGMVLAAASVSSIDGEPQPPATALGLRQIEAMIGRLDDHGIQAVGDGMQELYGASQADELAIAKK
jgi:hypothetical protein